MTDVYGVHSYAFCDFGDEFTIMDRDGEEPKESFVASITKVKLIVITWNLPSSQAVSNPACPRRDFST